MATVSKLVAFLISAFCLFSTSLFATTTIPVDLGPPGIDHFIFAPFGDLNGTHLSGQNLSLDFTSQPNEFIRIFTGTKGFGIRLDLILGNASPSSTPYSGTGYLIDNLGTEISPQRNLFLTPGTNQQGNLVIAGFELSPSLIDGGSNASLLTPLDFYGVHFDLTLPTTTTTVITSSHIAFSDDRNNSFGFGVGPGAPLPIDIVPETGNTFVMLTVAAAGILITRRFGQAR
jgi:hypothetical protein